MRKTRDFMNWVSVGLGIVAASLGGCSTQNATEEVVVYVAVDRKDAEPILQHYEELTGTKVRAVYDAEAAKTTGLVTRLIAERNSPRCDVFWNNEIVQSMQLAEEGLLAEYDSPAAAGIDPALRDEQHRWTGVAVRARVIVYNTELVSAEESPLGLQDLLDPKWRGKVAIANPGFGTTRTHVAALFAAWGEEKAQAYFKDLLANDVRIVDGNAMVKNLVGRAKADASPILVGLTDTDDVMSGQAEGMPIDMIYLDQDSLGTLVIPSTVCLVAGAPRAAAGRRLIDYLLGREAAERLTSPETGYFAAADLPRPGGQPLNIIKVSPAKVLEQLDPSTRWTAEHFNQ